MKKITHYSCIFLVWTFACLSSAHAYDFVLQDSDGDRYEVGPALGNTLGQQSYYVRYRGRSDSPFSSGSTGDGILYYNPDQYDDYHPVKIIIFENRSIFGFTLEGRWRDDPSRESTVYYINSGGQTGSMGIDLERTELTSRRSKQVRVKKVLKQTSLSK